MILTPPFPHRRKEPPSPSLRKKRYNYWRYCFFSTYYINDKPTTLFLAETHVKTRSTLINLRVIAVEMISLLPPFYTTADFGVNDLFKYVLSTTEESSKLE